MDLALAFLVFAGSMAFVLMHGWSMLIGMVIGFFAFFSVALHRHFAFKDIAVMSWKGAKKTLVVLRILLVIGILTGLWRSSGTFAFLVAWGMRLIRPSVFILMAYLLSCGMSYAIGTSFGVSGTLGVALMMLARGCGVDLNVTAGAILSGIYFGDRCSPASSCAALVASITDTKIYDNVKLMLKTAFPAVLVSIAFYAWISRSNPMASGSVTIVEALENCFNLNPLVALPTVFMLVMPMLGAPPLYAFWVSIACAFACSMFIQGMPFYETLRVAVMGFNAEPGTIKALFHGGGLISMINMCMIVFISGTYSGIFDGTKMLDSLELGIEHAINRFGSYLVTATIGLLSVSIFCNQSIGSILTSQMLRVPYRNTGRTKDELVQDMANSVVVFAGLVPWCIGCSVPLAMLGVSARAVPFAFYLYILPATYLLTKKMWFKGEKK